MKLREGKTILHASASSGHEQLVDFLCKNGAYINSRGDDGLTPLCTAVSKNHLEVVKVLLNHGADPKGSFQMALDLQYKSMALILVKHGTLHDVCLSSCPDSELLLEFFNILTATTLNVNASIAWNMSVDGFQITTPLQCAVFNGKEHFVKRLIELGADVNAKSGDNVTALHFAVRHKRVSIVECLLNNGADVSIAAGSYRDTELSLVAGFFYYRKSDGPSSEANFSDFQGITELLLKKGASVYSRNVFGSTPLHCAVRVKEFWPGIVRLLLDHGADANAVYEQDATPIFYAENAMILEMLIEKKADVNYDSKTFFTPVSQMLTLDRPSCVDVLLRNGADVNIKDSQGRTILEMNSPLNFYNNPELLEIIINQTSMTRKEN